MRRISTYGDGPSQQVSDVMQAVFVAELLAPSPSLWLVSPWVSDIPVVDNRGGEFGALLPGESCRQLTLSDLLLALAERGTRVFVVSRDHPSNRFVLQRLGEAHKAGAPINVQTRERIHDKGLLTSRFYLEGSMNFTFSGRELNEEGLTVNGAPDAIARMYVDFEGRFLEAGSAES